MNITERFLKYVGYGTNSDEKSETCPSTPNQLVLGAAIAEELKALGLTDVEQDADGHAELLGNTTDALDATVVLVVGSVREVKTGDVHARLDHLADGLVAIAGGTHGAYNLSALVHSDLHLTSSCADR